MLLRTCVLLALGALMCPAETPQATWRISYFYDKEQTDFNIADMACPAERRCIAVGAIEENGKLQPRSVATSDGGDNWSLTPIEEPPVSLFFLNESLGWMVTERGIWQTRNAGATWKKLKSEKNLVRAWFADPLHGWVVGAGAFRVTSNAGASWTNVPEAATTPAALNEITFEYIHFSDPAHGVVVGEATPYGRPAEDAWLRPGAARQRNPAAVILLGQTADGGRTWTMSSLGRRQPIVTAAFPGAGQGWLVFGPAAAVDLFSEVNTVDWTTGAANAAFHLNGALISAVAPGPDGLAVVAAIEIAGKLAVTPVPGRIRMFTGSALADLHSEAVDYRGVARRLMLTSAPAKRPGRARWFAATDTGMILRRDP